MSFKPTTIALALAAALLAVAPTAPASTAGPTPAVPTAPDVAAAPAMSAGPAWGAFYTSKSFRYYRYDAGDAAMFGAAAATVCTVAPIFLASGPAGAVVWGLSCSYAAVA